jgi:MoxR-like ATPase
MGYSAEGDYVSECRFCGSPDCGCHDDHDCQPVSTPVSPLGDRLDNSSFSLDEWEVAEAAIEHADRVLLYGVPGTGKTTAASLHATNGRQVNTITLTEETPAESIRGHFISNGTGFQWMNGPGVDAWIHGKRLVVNEIDKACGDASDFMHVMCDDQSVAALTLPNVERETVTPADGFQVVATMNGTPDCLPEAIQDRFSVTLEITKPHPKAIAALPEDLRDVARMTVAIDDSRRRIGVRKWKTFATLRVRMNDENLAAQACFGSSWRTLMSQIEMYRG